MATANKINLESTEAKMKELIEAFEAHPQLQAPTPHPTVFFMFDFVKNSYNTLQQVDAAKYASGDSQTCKVVNDVIGRNQFTGLLVTDMSGKLAAMTGGDPSNPVDFGANIKAKARGLNAA
ncbi:uncharacterized protein N7482_009745 [Penicillium canariense]|uniref:Uncharacterized protein n=1 Tax=Penicillium canariense TaxID=189055 RepID=A0A9W9HQJ6_9EURO|nr:uncharacterized protein N7482_009745 [Penicillium canariense]KAJ5153267.1 hypothetical protein N7482_009745 [Penicillium canariense]